MADTAPVEKGERFESLRNGQAIEVLKPRWLPDAKQWAALVVFPQGQKGVAHLLQGRNQGLQEGEVSDPCKGMVREFHEAFGLTVRDTPDTGFWNERELRVRLMLEEVLEFATAAEVRITFMGVRISSVAGLALCATGAPPNLVAMSHELGDVAYVTHGTAVQLGIPLLPVTAEIHSANMRKLNPDGKPTLDERGKVKKPAGWRPADVASVLKRLNEGEE